MSYAALKIREENINIAGNSPFPNIKLPFSPIHIVMAEDDASDAMLTRVSLDAMQINYELDTLQSGEKILSYLSVNKKIPDVLMLDLSLPAKDGFEVLSELAAKSKRFCELPIIIITGGKKYPFLKRLYGLNIASFITKPCSPEKLSEAFNSITKAKNN